MKVVVAHRNSFNLNIDPNMHASSLGEAKI
jgi:hypothetical protein